MCSSEPRGSERAEREVWGSWASWAEGQRCKAWCLGRVCHGCCQDGFSGDEPESSTGTEGHDVHGMDHPAVAVQSFSGGGVDATYRGLFLTSCPRWVDEVPGGLNHQGLLLLSARAPAVVSGPFNKQGLSTEHWPQPWSTHPCLAPWAHHATS